MDGRGRVLSDVSESELLEEDKFEDAVESFSDQEGGKRTPATSELSPTRSAKDSAEEVLPEQNNGTAAKSRQESLDKGKATSSRERRFKDLKSIQTVETSKKAIWCMKFSHCGRFLATGGADCEVRVWCSRSHLQEIDGTEVADASGFAPEPFATFKGHKNEILDLVWTEDFNLFSCSMDKDVKMWSLATKTCLGTLRHDAAVSSAKLLPKNRNFLATITFEGYLRLWDVPHRKVAGEIRVYDNLCTALEVIEEDSVIVVGTTDGKCLFFTKTLAAQPTLTISDKKPKVFDICSYGDKLLVTTDDSKTRMYHTRTRQLLMRFNGAPHANSLTRAAFSPDGQYIVSGAEDYCIYFWATNPALLPPKNELKQLEKSKIGRSPVTAALFAPKPEVLLSDGSQQTDVIISADCAGTLTVLMTSPPPSPADP